jgi:hypothetical protein
LKINEINSEQFIVSLPSLAWPNFFFTASNSVFNPHMNLSALQSGHPASSAAACLRRITPRSHRRQVAAQLQRTT